MSHHRSINLVACHHVQQSSSSAEAALMSVLDTLALLWALPSPSFLLVFLERAVPLLLLLLFIAGLRLWEVARRVNCWCPASHFFASGTFWPFF